MKIWGMTMSKPTLIVNEEIGRGTWSLSVAVKSCLEKAGQESESNRFVSELIQIHIDATEDEIVELIERFVNLETEESAVAKTRAKSKMPKVDLVKAGELALEYKTDAEKSHEFIGEMTVASAPQYEAAASMCADVISQAKEIDAKRREFVDPLNEVVKNLNAFFKPPLEWLDKCEAILKKKLVLFVNNEAEKRDQLLLQAGESDDSELSEELIEKAETHVPPALAGVSMRTTWIGEVVDPDKIPREYLIPDVKVLNALTKAKAGDPGIPGWKATPKTSPAITVSKVKL